MTLVWPLSCVTASVDDQVALELENLTAELTGFVFPLALVLSLGVGRTGGAESPLRGGWLWRVGEKWWWLGTGLKKGGTQQTMHGRHTIGRKRRCRSPVIGVTRKFPQTPREVHGTRLHGGHSHHPLKGTGVLGQQPHLFRAQTFERGSRGRRRADKGWRRRQSRLQIPRGRWVVPEQGRGHAEEVEWVVGVTEERGERRAGQGIGARRRRQRHARSEGAVAWLVVQVDADAVSVLGMLKQEPGTGEGLLTGSADVAGWLIFICWPKQK